jgi:hypothetical protein
VEEKACPVSRIHSDHQELTVGKVDDVHHAKDDSEAEGNQSKKQAHQDSLKKCIENNHGKLFPFKKTPLIPSPLMGEGVGGGDKKF